MTGHHAAELDAACERMRLHADALVAAVRNRDLEALDRLMAIEAASAHWVSYRFGLKFRDPDRERHCRCGWPLAWCAGLHGPATADGRWPVCCAHCTHPEPPEQVELNLRQLVGACAAADDDLLAELAREVDRWRAWAEVLTGWRTPLFRPHAPCPCCERTGSLRVNLDRATGLCMACGETWDRATLDDLADHIRDHGRAVTG